MSDREDALQTLRALNAMRVLIKCVMNARASHRSAETISPLISLDAALAIADREERAARTELLGGSHSGGGTP